VLDLAMIKSEHEELQTVYFALRSAWSTCRELMARQPELAEPVIPQLLQTAPYLALFDSFGWTWDNMVSVRKYLLRTIASPLLNVERIAESTSPFVSRR